MKEFYTKGGGFGIGVGLIHLVHKWRPHRIDIETNREIYFLPLPFVFVGYDEFRTTDAKSGMRLLCFKLGLFFWEIRFDVVLSTGIYAEHRKRKAPK